MDLPPLGCPVNQLPTQAANWVRLDGRHLPKAVFPDLLQRLIERPSWVQRSTEASKKSLSGSLPRGCLKSM